MVERSQLFAKLTFIVLALVLIGLFLVIRPEALQGTLIYEGF